MRRILCLGNNTLDTNDKSKNLSLTFGIKYIGLINSPINEQGEILAHTSMYDVTPSCLIEILNGFNEIILLKQDINAIDGDLSNQFMVTISSFYEMIEVNSGSKLISSHFIYNRLKPKNTSNKHDVFCIVPWIHMHGYPNGNAYPCCLADTNYPMGNFKENSMYEIWNSTEYKQLRKNMISGVPSKECNKCYEREKSGFFSMRNRLNRDFNHHFNLVEQTKEDGTFESFKIRYYDIRFSNLCNFKCRYCGGWFSSSYRQEELDIQGRKETPLLFAGKTETDMWEQIEEHIPYLEHIYFAGGEPLIMEEHYLILKELVKRKMFHVKIVYNTNFSRLTLKNEDVLDYWKLFDNVNVGASLDGSYARAEYMRKGTKWEEIVSNRRKMIKKCPNVDFYVSSTVSIFNALHIADFHKECVDLGLISARDWNINILQSPLSERIDVLPDDYKKLVQEKIEKHIEWLKQTEDVQQVVSAYESLVVFMNSQNNQYLLDEFFKKNDFLDSYRNENFEEVFLEYKDLRKYIIKKGST